MSRIGGALLISASILASGCSTFVRSEKATATAEGIEYSLPVPVIRVTPQADGTMTVVVDYLPDPDATYVLRTSSLLSSYTLDVQRENGLLKSVSLDAKSDDVAKSVVEAESNIIKARMDDASKNRAETAKALDDRTTSIEAAKLAVVLAQAKLHTLESNGVTGEPLLQAKLEVASAQAKLDFLVGNVANLRAISPAAFSAFAADAAQAGESGQQLTAAAPVLFRVVPVKPANGVEPWGVKLQAFDGMDAFLPTARVEAPPPPASAPVLQVPGSAAYEGHGTARLEVKVTIDRVVVRADPSTSKLVTEADNRDLSDRIASVNSETVEKGSLVTVTLLRPIPAGTYVLSLSLFGPGDKSLTGAVHITIL